MRRFSTTTIAGGLLAVLIVGLSAWTVYVNVARGEEVAADVRADRLPASPPAIYQKLQKRVTLDFQEITLDEALKSLESSLGAEILLDRAGIDAELFKRKYAVQVEEPVTIKLALQIVLQIAAVYDRKITFADGGVWLVGPEAAANRHVLQTYDLREASNYSTALRRGFIDRVQHDVAAESWGEAAGGWIAPASSVFGVDVYQTTEIHAQIDQLWQQEYVAQGGNRRWIERGDIVPETFGKERSPAEVKKLARKLREQYPLQSITERLQYEAGRAASVRPPLSPAVAQRISERETQAELARKNAWMGMRTAALEQLHGNEVAKFIAREGFGVSRMPQPGPSYLPLPAPPQLALPSAEVEPPAYAAAARTSQGGEASAAAAARLPSPDKLSLFHSASEGTFLSAERLGYVQDRDHVAGFGGHAFMSLPRLEDQGWHLEPSEQWAIRRLELVSILKQKTPRVYVSDELPNMEKLAEAPTRALGEFERRALAKLFDGEDVVTQTATNRIEMLGALRATKQCIQCHDVQRGEVLGAFSYTLLRDPAVIEMIEAH